jgi:hypothetical protein
MEMVDPGFASGRTFGFAAGEVACAGQAPTTVWEVSYL